MQIGEVEQKGASKFTDKGSTKRAKLAALASKGTAHQSLGGREHNGSNSVDQGGPAGVPTEGSHLGLHFVRHSTRAPQCRGVLS